jgi:formyltetrahydrofolate synthetase
MANLEAHIATPDRSGCPSWWQSTSFPTDSQREHDLIKEMALAAGALDAVTTEHHANGGEGATELAEAVDPGM